MISNLLAARRALRYGVGMTTRLNRVLPSSENDAPIPERIGVGRPLHDAPKTDIVEDRTFVFSVFNGTIATIANRIAGSTAMRIVRSNLAVSAASYCIGALNTFLSKWRDCWRIDANTFGINGHVPPVTVGVGVVPTHERSSLPLVVNDGSYYAACIGDATRSTLFIGKVQESITPRVLSIATDGTQKSVLTATNCANTAFSACGARIDAAGNFRFYGMNMSQAANAVFYLYPGWSIISPSRKAPYLTETAHGEEIRTQVRGNPYIDAYNGVNFAGTINHTSAGYSIAPTLCPFYLGSTVTARRFPEPNPSFTMEWDEILDDLYYLTPGDYEDGGAGTQTSTVFKQTIDNSVSAYGYAGSDIQLSLAATLAIDYASSRRYAVRYYDFYAGGNLARFSGGSEHVVSAVSTAKTTLALGSSLAALGEMTYIECTVTGNYSYNDVYVPTVVSVPGFGSTATQSASYGSAEGLAAAIAVQEAEGYGKLKNPATLSPHNVVRSDVRGSTLLARTRDYIFADIEEDVFLTLDSVLTWTRSETYNFTTKVWTPTDVFSLTLKYVLRIRGATYEFPVYSGSSFTVPKIETVSMWTGDAGYKSLENYHGEYHAGYKPLPVFTPPFMAQGNCPYIAYTTKGEELAGATPEFYLDIAVKILQYTTFAGTRYDGTVPFIPHQFLAMFRRYIGAEAKSTYPTYPLTQNTTFWATLFPTATPFRIQFANGVAGAWNTSLGSTFAANPATEISRI